MELTFLQLYADAKTSRKVAAEVTSPPEDEGAVPVRNVCSAIVSGLHSSNLKSTTGSTTVPVTNFYGTLNAHVTNSVSAVHNATQKRLLTSCLKPNEMRPKIVNCTATNELRNNNCTVTGNSNVGSRGQKRVLITCITPNEKRPKIVHCAVGVSLPVVNNTCTATHSACTVAFRGQKRLHADTCPDKSDVIQCAKVAKIVCNDASDLPVDHIHVPTSVSSMLRNSCTIAAACEEAVIGSRGSPHALPVTYMPLKMSTPNTKPCTPPHAKSVSLQTNQYLSSHTPRKVALRKKLHVSYVSATRRKDQLNKLTQKYKEKLANVCGSRTSVEQVISDVGKYLKGDAFNFVAHQLRMSQHPPKGRRYSDEMRLLSLALYNSGPKAYAYLSEIFVLPSKVSLTKWLRNVRSSPGFNEETFTALKERMKFMPERDKVCSLMIDEISLKKNLQYDSQNDVIVGYEDFGGQFERSKEYAGNALVFMLRGLASNWNQPVGYVFTRTACKAEVVQALISECLDKCKESGCDVKVVVSDQGTNFQSLVRKLGVTPENPYFSHGGHKYFYMYDPPHLLKSIRNNLNKYTIQFGDKKATWGVIENYYKTDVQQTFRLTPKLTDRHIYLPPFSKMKVKWAAQVISRSLAAALETHKTVLGSDAEGTAEFLAKFNDIFDAVNSSNLYSMKKLCSALSDRSGHIDFLQQSKQWIASLKVVAGSDDITSSVKCLHGWQLTLNCILQLWPVLRDEHNFTFLCTRRLNQDPLEQFFSVIRQRGGKCQNPTPLNFSRIYKSVTCQKLLKPVQTGNCEMNVTQILGTLSACKIPANKKVVKKVAKSNASINGLQIIPAINQWNAEKVKRLQDNALHYVCGYVLRKIRKWHECTACDKILLGGNGYAKHNETFTMLKKFTPEANLVNASQAFHWYVVRCENVLLKQFEKHSYKPDISSTLVEKLKSVYVPTRCMGFPKYKFLIFFVRVRIFYLLKFFNASLNSSKPKNKANDFGHK